MNSNLLCTFVNKKDFESTIIKIRDNYDILYNKIFVMQNEEKMKEFICTYNIDSNEKKDYNIVPNTILLHRKKQTNTLYTINALNEIIKNINNGILDKNTIIDWGNYENMLLITVSNKLVRIKTKFYKIINID